MRQLDKKLLRDDVNQEVVYETQDNLPEKIIQFGEGNFLRGFVDWMIQEMNKQGLFNGKVVAIQPTPHGKVVPKLNAQDSLYTLTLRGVLNGQVVDNSEIISSISRGINPYSDWMEVLKVAESTDIEFVFSNTTEAGLTYLKEDYTGLSAPLSFPGKLAGFLYHRYKSLGEMEAPGLTIIPCELVENNGDVLKDLVLKYANDWTYPNSFINWVEEKNRFCNTLVDRIVTGYPRGNEKEFQQMLGYEDVLMTVGEPYHLFAIEADKTVAAKLPFTAAGLNVKWGDVKPLRDMKVRLLNGPHTMMFAASYLSGVDTVLDAMEDPDLRKFVEKGLYEELLPYVSMDSEEKSSFADSVIERFLNPYTKHYLPDIGMNAVYKFKSRLVPSLKEYAVHQNKLPEAITFSLAALMVYYKSTTKEGDFLVGKRNDSIYTIRDNQETISLFENVWEAFKQNEMTIQELVTTVLTAEELWGMNLAEIPDLNETISLHVEEILTLGMEESVRKLVNVKQKSK
ncbi:tagaturonate reductase [Sutcliffiella rhizosphaerae]|uniref:Altronate oxidoreductase n=1 Tax=Sutcliffiella rhizosphaerae TaxID=2880967 RepID=A0ABN8AB89_9BACI|nr:tagaturonate reductase [Sutcliffiella rhizosphaerae]CAG9620937.1 Altronate oxidoreductase [Sutcliffiella rhizosphaerae]